MKDKAPSKKQIKECYECDQCLTLKQHLEVCKKDKTPKK